MALKNGYQSKLLYEGFKVKIAFIINSLKKGGAERVVSLLSKELSKSNDVTIILFDEIIDYEFAGKLININCVTKKSIYGKTINVLNRTLKLKKIF